MCKNTENIKSSIFYLKIKKIILLIILSAGLIQPVNLHAEETEIIDVSTESLIELDPWIAENVNLNLRIDGTTNGTTQYKAIQVDLAGTIVASRVNINQYQMFYRVESTTIKREEDTSTANNRNAPVDYYGVTNFRIELNSDQLTNKYASATLGWSPYYKQPQYIYLGQTKNDITSPRKLKNIAVTLHTPNITEIQTIQWYTYSGLASGGSGGSIDDSQTSENVTQILDALTTSEEVIEALQTQKAETAEQINDAIETEKAIQQTANQNINAIDPATQIQTHKTQGLINALQWVRQIHAQTVEQTEIGHIIGLYLIIGLGAYLIGRRRG